MSMPIFYKCNPCGYYYDAIVDMDYFHEDSRLKNQNEKIFFEIIIYRKVLEGAGVGQMVAVSHLNSRGANRQGL